jgi:hypothetical protein
MSNYDDLLREKENNEFFENDRMQYHWSVLENKLDNNIKPTNSFNKGIKYILAVAAIAIVGFFGFKFLKNNKTNTPEIASTTEKKSAIKPPLTWANLPYEKFEFDATIGDTIFTQNGSIIVFPANALLHNNGEIVKGKVEIKSREFNDALDYSIAGIPMGYDSAGIKYTFISSGMIDINAFQNGVALQVNPNAKPTLNLVSTNREKNTNLYKLDTVTGVWANKGKDILINIGKENNKTDSTQASVMFYPPRPKGILDTTGKASDFFYNEEAIVKPLAPQKPSNKNPIINIEFVPGSFKELAIYDGLKFEVIRRFSESNNFPSAPTPQKPSVQKPKIPKPDQDFVNNNQTNNTITGDVERNSKIDWENIELVKTNVEGEYNVIFTSGKQNVTYVVKPVLEGIAYETAEKRYQQKMKEYDNAKTNRLQELSNAKAAEYKNALNDSIEDAKMTAQNKSTTALNKIIEKRNELVEARNKFMEAQKKLFQEAAIEAEKYRKKIELENAQSAEILRSFEIDGFGYWNCDQPTVPAPMYVNAIFSDSKNKPLKFSVLHVAVQNVNRLLDGSMFSLPYLPNQKQCVFTYANDKCYYLSYSQFEKLNINTSTKNFTFILNEFVGDKKDYSSLKKLLLEPAG